MWPSLLRDLLRGLGRMELLYSAEGGVDVDGHVAGDLRNERTGFTTDVLGLKDDS